MSESETFISTLIDRVLARVTERPPRAIGLLGFTPATIAVEKELTFAGFRDRIVGVFDVGYPIGAPVIELQDLAHREHDLLIVCSDAHKADLLTAYRSCVGDRPDPPDVVLSGTAHLAFSDADFALLDEPALVPSYANGSPLTRAHIFQCLQASARAGLCGTIAEFGAFKGGTTAWLARVARHFGLTKSRVVGFDSWDGFPPRRSVLDLYEHPRCIFKDIDAVRAYVEPFGVELVAGDISETYRILENEPLLLCFFDTDNYSPTRAALGVCSRQLIVGGSIVFDHVATTDAYVDTIGERIAAYEVLQSAGFLHLHGTGVFTKIA